eukprot:7314820-Prymnesium_polylepis.1
MAAAFGFLREKGAFPEDAGDSDDEPVFGDDAFDEMNGWLGLREGHCLRAGFASCAGAWRPCTACGTLVREALHGVSGRMRAKLSSAVLNRRVNASCS